MIMKLQFLHGEFLRGFTVSGICFSGHPLIDLTSMDHIDIMQKDITSIQLFVMVKSGGIGKEGLGLKVIQQDEMNQDKH